MNNMFDPPHPGETLREDVLPALEVTVTEAVKQIGVSRVALSRVLNGRAAISPEMALRLVAWLGLENGGSAEVWLSQQMNYDLWQARQKVALSKPDGQKRKKETQRKRHLRSVHLPGHQTSRLGYFAASPQRRKYYSETLCLSSQLRS